MQVSTATPPPKPTPVYAEPFRPSQGQTKAQMPLGGTSSSSLRDSIRTAPDSVDILTQSDIRPPSPVDILALDSGENNAGSADDVSDDYV